MKGTGFEPIIRDAAIKAIDGVSKKFENARSQGEGALARLLRRWDSLDQQQKEQFIAVAITIGTAAAAAISALGEKRTLKRAKKAAAKVAKKVT